MSCLGCTRQIDQTLRISYIDCWMQPFVIMTHTYCPVSVVRDELNVADVVPDTRQPMS